jgi:hypothetical protein
LSSDCVCIWRRLSFKALPLRWLFPKRSMCFYRRPFWALFLASLLESPAPPTMLNTNAQKRHFWCGSCASCVLAACTSNLHIARPLSSETSLCDLFDIVWYYRNLRMSFAKSPFWAHCSNPHNAQQCSKTVLAWNVCMCSILQNMRMSLTKSSCSVHCSNPPRLSTQMLKNGVVARSVFKLCVCCLYLKPSCRSTPVAESPKTT